jgi:type IV secretory pathway VirB2 component (pilin)
MLKFLKNFSLKVDTKDAADSVESITTTRKVIKVLKLSIPIIVVVTLCIALLTGKIDFEQFTQGTEQIKP